MRSRRPDADLLAGLALGAVLLAPLVPVWLRGLTPFWGDLTYIHFPWRAFDAEVLAAGRMPLWNPFLYFGMPQAATMQDSLFYPGSTPFFLFDFATGLALFHAAHYALAGVLCYLWLRFLRLARGPAFAGAVLYAGGGLALSRMPFLNHLALLALMPALLLFFRRPGPLALALALSILAGYPPFFAGAAALAWFLAGAGWSGRQRLADSLSAWFLAGAGAIALTACLLLPALELFRLSRRSSGVPLEEALNFAFSAGDLRLWISPTLARGFSAAVSWWKSAYIGFAGCLAVLLGLAALPRRRALPLAAWLGTVIVAATGAATAPGLALWTHFPPLRFIRYPGNLVYLASPPLAFLAAEGARRRPWLALVLIAELLVCAAGSFPTAPRALFADVGPLARRLQGELGGNRYLLSPRALEAGSGAGVRDWRWRLYGLTNAPLRLAAAANFGEPLVPAANYELMDRLLSAPGAAAAAALLPSAGVAVLMTPGPVQAPGLKPEGETLWKLYRLQAAGPPALLRAREDRFDVSGAGGAWARVPEPLYPGWKAVLETGEGVREVPLLPSDGPFMKAKVPEGPWALHFRYDPGSWRLGLATTTLALMALAWYWYNRLMRSAPAPR